MCYFNNEKIEGCPGKDIPEANSFWAFLVRKNEDYKEKYGCRPT